MPSTARGIRAAAPFAPETGPRVLRSLVIGATAFLTVVDLFATQAVLPMLASAYRVAPATMGVAVNASTVGMAVASLAVAFFSQRLDRRRGILASLTLLAVPTGLLAIAPDLTTFAALRVCQGVLMATAFTLTLAHLGEHCSADDAGAAFAAYITGNVASNLVGRLIAASVSDNFGLATNFLVLAALNLVGVILVYFTIDRVPTMRRVPAMQQSALGVVATHLRNPALRAAFAIGFCILFAFIGTFTYVNFVLVRPPLLLGMMGLGLVYFVFLPSIFTTPVAGVLVGRFGTRIPFWSALAIAGLGLPLLLLQQLPAVICGMMLVAAGTFFAQAVATGFVGHAAESDRGAASGMYLASYFFGGLVGSVLLGQVFDGLGWRACVTGIGLALAAAALLGGRLLLPARNASDL